MVGTWGPKEHQVPGKKKRKNLKKDLERIASYWLYPGAVIFWQIYKDVFSLQHAMEKLELSVNHPGKSDALKHVEATACRRYSQLIKKTVSFFVIK